MVVALKRGIEASLLVKHSHRLVPCPFPEQGYDLLPGFQIDNRGICDGIVELPELPEDGVHPLGVVEVGRRLAEQVERIVLALVSALVLAAEAPLERLLGGGLDALLSHASRAPRPGRAPRRRRG